MSDNSSDSDHLNLKSKAATLSLLNATRKIMWGREFINGIRQNFETYLVHGNKRSYEYDDNGLVIRIKIDVAYLPVQIGLCLGGAIHAFRSALDGAMSEIMALAKPELSRVYFPFHESRDSLLASFEKTEKKCGSCGAITKGKGANVDIKRYFPDLIDVIVDEIKPYKSGNYPLWTLSKLDNIQKHRIIILATAVTQTIDGSMLQSHLPIEPCPVIHTIYPGNTADYSCPPTEESKLVFSRPSGRLIFPLDAQFFPGKDVLSVLENFAQLATGVIETLKAHLNGGEG